jgi:hypothetical protein
MSVRIRRDFIGPRAGECPNVDLHDGIRHTLEERRQHLIDVHGFVYSDGPEQQSRRECPRCHGEGWIDELEH